MNGHHRDHGGSDIKSWLRARSRSPKPGHGHQSYNDSGYSNFGSSYKETPMSSEERSQLDKFFEKRRYEREKIGLAGVPEVWGKLLPEPDEEDSDLESEKEQTEDKSTTDMSKEKGHKRKHHKSKHHKSKHHKKHKKHHKKSKKSKSKKAKHSGSDESSSDTGSSDASDSEEAEPIWMEKKNLHADGDGHDPDIIGPELEVDTTNDHLTTKDFGKALLPGEGAAMAAYIAEGKRIPRRGEIGLTSDEIVGYEQIGYVMSGSRYTQT